MAWRHGYGKMSDYYVNRKNKGMSQDTNEGEMRMDESAFVQMLANKNSRTSKRTKQARVQTIDCWLRCTNLLLAEM